METVISIGAAVVSLVSLALGARRKRRDRMLTLFEIVKVACLYAEASPQSGIPAEKVALEAAILSDLKDNGKRDYSDAELLIAIRAELGPRL